MLGSGLLHEIVKEKGIHHPSQILNELRKKVMTSLRQTGEMGDSQDGMDVVVMKLYVSNKMEYACANNGIVVVRGEETINLKGDKMPVGYSLKMDDFTNNEFQLNNGDWVYAYTDGYPDQFGGTSAKKFMYGNLNKLLKSISPNQASTQYNQLHETFEKWIHVEETGKTFEQIDDVCILGFRIGE
jgi:serine phosphatase RsbU (regulator of sigma subunit)